MQLLNQTKPNNDADDHDADDDKHDADDDDHDADDANDIAIGGDDWDGQSKIVSWIQVGVIIVVFSYFVFVFLYNLFGYLCLADEMKDDKVKQVAWIFFRFRQRVTREAAWAPLSGHLDFFPAFFYISSIFLRSFLSSQFCWTPLFIGFDICSYRLEWF